MKSTLRALSLVVATALLTSASAFAAEPEKVVVRNRKFTVDGKLDATALVGFTLVNYLTQHVNLNGAVAYNVTEQFGLELAGGYALSGHTNVAERASTAVVSSELASANKEVNDFEDLWQMTWNATGAVRWAPIYGKMNVAAELPLHFQAYLLAGAGAGGMVRDSLVYCIGTPTVRKQATCVAGEGGGGNALVPLHQSAVKPVAVAGAGLRLFFNQWSGLRLEIKDVAFPDSYLTKIPRASAEADVAAKSGAQPTQGQVASNPGFTHLVFVNLGATFSF